MIKKMTTIRMTAINTARPITIPKMAPTDSPPCGELCTFDAGEIDDEEEVVMDVEDEEVDEIIGRIEDSELLDEEVEFELEEVDVDEVEVGVEVEDEEELEQVAVSQDIVKFHCGECKYLFVFLLSPYN